MCWTFSHNEHVLLSCDQLFVKRLKVTNLKPKNELDWGSSGYDAVTGVVDKQEVQDTQQSHESCTTWTKKYFIWHK